VGTFLMWSMLLIVINLDMSMLISIVRSVDEGQHARSTHLVATGVTNNTKYVLSTASRL
jgi:hypothetical protein